MMPCCTSPSGFRLKMHETSSKIVSFSALVHTSIGVAHFVVSQLITDWFSAWLPMPQWGKVSVCSKLDVLLFAKLSKE
jgi:hypothetical protein